METLNIFDSYKPQTKAEWLELVQQELKTSDLSSLKWNIGEEISLEPYYNSEDLKDISYPSPVYHDKHLYPKWQNLEKIVVENTGNANIQALRALNNGADGIIFELTDSPIELDVLLKNILLQHCSIYFTGQETISTKFLLYCEQNNIALRNLYGGVLAPSEITTTIEIIKKNPELPFRLFFIGTQGDKYKNEPIKLLTDALLQIVKILDLSTHAGMDAKNVFQNLIIGFDTTNSYYLEICKIRAVRLLLTGLAQAYDVPDFDPGTVHIHHETSPLHTKDDNQNMIRNTVQAMSAILGGCDSIYIAPHDFDKHSEFSRRIARNISLILKEEAYFDKVSDPAAGSYFLESLTKDIVEKVWKNFITIEKEKP
jgi:methylmalonyl-CoA mutase